MNKENAHQYLSLIQALAEGKTIQYRSGSQWNDMIELEFVDPLELYRIKPEPREWDMYLTPKGELTPNSDMMMRESIRVREILD
jgi:hypothetical protein